MQAYQLGQVAMLRGDLLRGAAAFSVVEVLGMDDRQLDVGEQLGGDAVS